MTDDFLIACLRRLCGRFDADPLRGRYTVASEAGISEQYIYQILAGKPLTSGKRRSIGPSVRQKLTAKYPGWMSLDDEAKPRPMVAEPTALPYVHPHPIARQVIALMESTDDAGKGIILMAASQALEKYRPVKETAA